MIAGLCGKLEIIGNDWAIINTGGIIFQVYMPASALSTIGAIGQEVRVYTHLHVREDNMSLYGFATTDELRLFEILLSGTGVGPRIGLSMLSVMSAEQLCTAIVTGNTDTLMTVPGVGKKMASRLVLELKDKINTGWMAAPAAQLADNSDILGALASLGYSTAEASRAVAALPPSPDMNLEEKLRLSLRYFEGK